MGLKQDMEFLKAVLAAGFGMVGVQSVDTDDGYAWNGTLVKGKLKVVTVSNGGFGGPDEFEYPNGTRDDVRAALGELFQLPVVVKYWQDFECETLGYSLEANKISPAEYEEKCAAIRASSPQYDDEDFLGLVVDQIRGHLEARKKMLRKIKGNLLWFRKGEEDGERYLSLKVADTPTNRALVMKKYPDIGCFINDLVPATI